ncbi:ester cyclase [Chloroflexota bacterium]
MSDDNKALARRYYKEGFNDGNPDGLDEIFAPEFNWLNAPPGVPADAEGLKGIIAAFRAAFPDLHVEIVAQIEEGDTVATRTRSRGTHTGELMGVAATGKEIRIEGSAWARIAGGRIVEMWGVADQLTMMRQIGALPSPD